MIEQKECLIFAENLSAEAFEFMRLHMKSADEHMLRKNFSHVTAVLCINLLVNLLQLHSNMFVTTKNKKKEIFNEMLASIVKSVEDYDINQKETLQ